MDFQRSKRLMAIWAACYWILAVTIYLVAGQQFHYTAVTSDALSATTTVGELVDGLTITQRLIAPAESLTGFDLMAATYGRSNTGTLHAVFTNNAGEVVAAKDIDIATLPESKYFTISLDSVAQVIRLWQGGSILYKAFRNPTVTPSTVCRVPVSYA